jgi:two-component system, chemotaxis family, CheB/CheR fusion protein
MDTDRPGFPIVGVGASAGGLEALEELFGSMPADMGLAFVVVTHQHPGHTSMLPELLAKTTDMPVRQVAGATKLEPNHVYVAPPGFNLAILNGSLQRIETERNESPRLPIDYFFRSLAEDRKERAICIVLSGTGTDGTLGLREIKAQSGMAMVEQPQSAKYAGMPSSAIATGLVDYVLSPAAMPAQLIAYAKGPYLQGVEVAAEASAVSTELTQKVLVLLRGHTGHDFSSYKSNTLRRRIERRMNVHQIDEPTEYLFYLQENPHEIDLLFKELLISVTSFFRDPNAWEALGPALKDLIQSRSDEHTLRAWVPGCATGEEAYSLAILLRECLDELQRPPSLQIFGTDLDAGAIEAARTGRYPDGIRADVLPRRLERYFLQDDGTYGIRKEVRDTVIFALQNVIKDPPFTKLDVISCRNLLIYMKPDLQEKLLPMFHHALKPEGLLFLGPSESIGSPRHLFETLDKRWKVFRRKESLTDRRALLQIPARLAAGDQGTRDAARTEPSVKEPRHETTIERVLLQQLAPPCVVVNERGDIVYIHGRTGMYLEPSRGQPRNNILEMAREGLQIELASAMRQCAASGTEVVREGVRVKTNSEFHSIKLTVAKLHEPEAVRDLLLVTFHPLPPDVPETPGKSRPRRKKTPGAERTEQLERELQHIKEAYRATVEESQTLNEELQSNNEELQSSNEELETSKEELESLNEELTTVNAQLQSKLSELSQVNDDMQNLLNSTDIATIFLDADLNTRRYTEKATRLVMLRPTDVGRPIFELASNLEYEGLAADCREVLSTLMRKERIVHTTGGESYLMRIVPYRTTENVIDGLVLTFVDIERFIQAARETERSGEFFKHIVETVRHPLLVLDKELRVVFVNNVFCDTFRTKRDETEGRVIYDLGNGQWDIPELRKLIEEMLPMNTSLNDYEVECEFPAIGRRRMLLNARRMRRTATLPATILLAIEDTTENRRVHPGIGGSE